MAKAQEKYQFLPEGLLYQLQKAHFDTVVELAEAIALLISGQPPFNKYSHPKAPCPSGQARRDFPVASGIRLQFLGTLWYWILTSGVPYILGITATKLWAPWVSGEPPQGHPATLGPHMLVDDPNNFPSPALYLSTHRSF